MVETPERITTKEVARFLLMIGVAVVASAIPYLSKFAVLESRQDSFDEHLHQLHPDNDYRAYLESRFRNIERQIKER